MKKLIFVGGGHAHLHCIKSLANEQLDSLHVTLISPTTHQYYSGMFSGYTEGLYKSEDVSISLPNLCNRANVTMIEDTIIRVDAKQKQLIGLSGSVYTYDAVSFDIGSTHEQIPNLTIPIKPNFHFPSFMTEMRKSPYPVIIGGGAAGIEIACSIQAWKEREKENGVVTLITPSLLPTYSPSIQQKVKRLIEQRNIRVITDKVVIGTDSTAVTTSTGHNVPYSSLLMLTGAKSLPLFEHSTLKTDEEGFLLTNSMLQSVEDSSIFGAGDCITMDSYPKLPKNGVYAVRQGPILFENIMNYIKSKPLKSFQPQKRFLAILSLGNHKGLLLYGDYSYYGALAWRLKNKIDRNFMSKYQL
ncbi:FAD-dependent oxidoreductase [Metabacillus iocasae]|uniref:NADH dehydrogenase FAD-containing subunit n=1 Tax=Priestia iocasae TaxID=2291674 RepID=A0ABS2QVY9_9BACI|nr:FAD-dependent oxidoreductase [Metabacillus iocasae]MBM7703634.1 NADH dehydrogenase FAD-containing subunit [Metabacillus iocasae]